MRGKRDRRFDLVFFEEGFEKPKEFVIERGTVKVKSVNTRISTKFWVFAVTIL